jgi:serine/threonine protein kinase
MAPEVGANILKTSEYNCTVDMWSIGCVLFQSLTGSVPFEEHEMCKLFLHCACSNFYDDMYPEFPADTHQSDVDLIKGLLEIDRSKRLIPEVLYSMALKRMQNKNV